MFCTHLGQTRRLLPIQQRPTFEGGRPVVYGQLFIILVPSLHNIYKNRCIITAGCIWLHVSTVTQPSSGQQGIVLLRYIQLVFPHVSAVTRPSSDQQGIVLLRYIQLVFPRVSAVTRPSSGQQGIVLLRYIRLVFSMGSHYLH